MKKVRLEYDSSWSLVEKLLFHEKNGRAITDVEKSKPTKEMQYLSPNEVLNFFNHACLTDRNRFEMKKG